MIVDRVMACLVEANLAFNLDFRNLYTEILEDCFQIEAKPVTKGTYEKLGFLK